MSIGTDYIFTTREEKYNICGKVLDSIKRTKCMLKMKHVKKYDMTYTLYDKEEKFILSGNASKDWVKMKDEVYKIKSGRLNVQCIEIYKY